MKISKRGLKNLAALATVVGIVMEGFEYWFEPDYIADPSSPMYPVWLKLLGYAVASAGALAYIVIDRFYGGD